MLNVLKLLMGTTLVLIGYLLQAQRIVYSDPERDDSQRMNFEIIGKFRSSFLIYKNNRNRDFIAVYDNDMNQTGKVEMDYIPNDRLINLDFFPYGDFTYVIYQYQRKNVIYCLSTTIDAAGNKMGDPTVLDTTHIGFAANNKIYTVITNEDKSKIAVFKVNSRDKKNYILTTVLYNNNLELLTRGVMNISMNEHADYLDQFHLDNEGGFVFAKFKRSNNDIIESASIMVKPAYGDTLFLKDLNLGKNLLDEIHIKIDNIHKRYFLTSFYYTQRRGNIDGIYFFVYDKTSMQPVMENIAVFGEELRKEAKGEANIKAAFNDYFIKNIIIKKDAGFLIGSEAYYTTSRYNSWNRWDYMYGNPFMSPYSYYYSPYYNNLWWRNNNFRNNQSVRSHADNIVVLSFASDGKLEWSNVISKDQFDDEGDSKISYQLMNTGEQLHFLFNQQEKRVLLLNDYSVVPNGQINRNPTLKNLDRGYEFMPKYGKQVSSKQMIIPCFYRNYICFAKIDYNQ